MTQEQVWKLWKTAFEGKRMTQGERERSGWSVRIAERAGQAMLHVIYRF